MEIFFAGVATTDFGAPAAFVSTDAAPGTISSRPSTPTSTSLRWRYLPPAVAGGRFPARSPRPKAHSRHKRRPASPARVAAIAIIGALL